MAILGHQLLHFQPKCATKLSFTGIHSRTKKAPRNVMFPGLSKATLTGLEPATTGSTVRYSNQLSYSALARFEEIILSSASWQDVKAFSEIDSQNCIQFPIFDTFSRTLFPLFGSQTTAMAAHTHDAASTMPASPLNGFGVSGSQIRASEPRPRPRR